jgi:hypothetical protein
VASGQDVRRAYGLAGAHGAANTGCRPDRERAYGVLRLLTLATLRMPDLVLYAQLAAMLNDETEPGGVRRVALRAVVDIATGAVRLTHQAIEVHGRDLDYAIAAWIELAVERAGCELEHHALDHDAEVPVAVDQARLATIALTRATAATATDPMLVPAEAANAVGHLLTVYLLASAAAT